MAELSTQKAHTASPWIWVALLVTVAFTVWTAIHDEPADDAADLLSARSPKNAGRINDHVTKSQNDDSLLLGNETKVVMAELRPWQNLNRQASDQPIKNIFRPHSWEVIPKIIEVDLPPPEPPPAPQAPPLPFTYMGKLDQGSDGTQIFLMQNNKVLTTQVGDNVNHLWRLDAETEFGLTFTFLPLEEQKELSKNASNNNGNF